MKRNKTPVFVIVILSIMMLIQPGKLCAQNIVTPQIIMLSSYSISGNMLTDKVITLHLVFKNTSQTRDVNDVLISFTSVNNIFLPAYGVSNQFFIPKMKAGETVEEDLQIAVNDPLPNDILYFDFTILFSDPLAGQSENSFFISDSVKDANVIQLVGMDAVAVNSADGESRIITFRATVINHSNFLVKNATMILEGKAPDFTVSIPLNDIGPGNFLANEFHLTLQTNYIPKFDVKFSYIDINGASYYSDSQRITVYLNNILTDGDTKNADEKIQSLVRKVGLLLFFLFLAVVAVLFYIRLRKKKGF